MRGMAKSPFLNPGASEAQRKNVNPALCPSRPWLCETPADPLHTIQLLCERDDPLQTPRHTIRLSAAPAFHLSSSTRPQQTLPHRQLLMLRERKQL
ncbi:hypothetical protein DPEC_G00132650 [Dallia pectoralis]|uniref:Uncharacterized protein n=1 Tax=Dallia pectoralis TaxID=75939 RepID=A0ACC2GRP7_DALPE|nr:hypothetical protein DPEC_G00132650 [Dallia pectoralis]